MPQRFAPINNAPDGWRRLNVLFTRAKKRMLVFSSMDSGFIKTTSTTKRGVKSLKDGLHYCETGFFIEYKHTGKEAESPFEVAVNRALDEHSYECETQLGVSGYRLDLAVRDRPQPRRFLMGVECDDASYHPVKSARERDRLRQDVLENIGCKQAAGFSS